MLLAALPFAAQQHRATRLGNPATRFAPPLFPVDDLRAHFQVEYSSDQFEKLIREDEATRLY